MMSSAAAWHPIEDYEFEPETLAHAELSHLAAIWLEQREEMERLQALAEFNERLEREWAVETGLIERIYTLDRGVTQLLIERGIDATLIPHHHEGQDPRQVAAIISDHKSVIEGLFAFVRGERELTVSYVRQLHAQLTRNQRTVKGLDSLGRLVEVDLLHGEYKKRPNNPTRINGLVHEYCPPEHVATEMERLLELYHTHTRVAPEVEAAWLHHRFTQIHPFQDGNGRVARALASLVFLRHHWFPLVIRDTKNERENYIDALESADQGDLKPLVRVFAMAQKKAFVQALGISGQVLRLTRAEQVIHATREKLDERNQSRRSNWEKAKDTARDLQEVAGRRFEEIVKLLEKELIPVTSGARFWSESVQHGDERDHYFRWQIITTARDLDYYADTREYRAWTRLVLRGETQAEIFVSFHGSGHEFRGVLAASCCFFRREETDEGERQVVDLTSLSDEIFQVNYREETVDAEVRFRDWLEEALVRGLELWRKTL